MDVVANPYIRLAIDIWGGLWTYPNVLHTYIDNWPCRNNAINFHFKSLLLRMYSLRTCHKFLAFEAKLAFVLPCHGTVTFAIDCLGLVILDDANLRVMGPIVHSTVFYSMIMLDILWCSGHTQVTADSDRDRIRTLGLPTRLSWAGLTLFEILYRSWLGGGPGRQYTYCLF